MKIRLARKIVSVWGIRHRRSTFIRAVKRMNCDTNGRMFELFRALMAGPDAPGWEY